MPKQAKLILVGAGPGDPELITLKALKAIERTDYILYDALVNLKIFNLANRDLNDEKLIFVGKRQGESYKQESINQKILKILKDGHDVMRLKGGDPLVFARGFEEIELVNDHGYDWEIIPGLTSSLGLASMHNITLTLREKSDSITLATAHEINSERINIWVQILRSGAALALYMGISNIVYLCQEIDKNLKENIPAIVIASGSLLEEKVIFTDVKNLAQDIINHSINSPAMIYLGKNIQSLDKNIKKNLFSNTKSSFIFERSNNHISNNIQ
jgi:uroporphyrin-III C-methyltransferase